MSALTTILKNSTLKEGLLAHPFSCHCILSFEFLHLMKYPCIHDINVFHCVSCIISSAVFVRTKHNTSLQMTAMFG